MANKIVVVFLMCLVLAEVSNVRARITPQKSRSVHRERFLCANEPPKQHHPTAESEKFKTCFHACKKDCPRDSEHEYLECELSCDRVCSLKEKRNLKEPLMGERVPSGHRKGVANIEEKPSYKFCNANCEETCPSGDAKCLKECHKECRHLTNELHSQNKA